LRLAAQEYVVRGRPAHIHDECFNIARHREAERPAWRTSPAF
jgi:hypothetical protein